MAAAENKTGDTAQDDVVEESPPPRAPIVQLVWDVAQLARSMARVHARRERPSRRGQPHFV